MESMNSTRTLTLTASEVDLPSLAHPWTHLLPLWRHAVWFALLFAVSAVTLSIRLDVQKIRIDLARNAGLVQEAQILNERLQLEWDVRRRTAAIEAVARQMSMTADLSTVRVEKDR